MHLPFAQEPDAPTQLLYLTIGASSGKSTKFVTQALPFLLPVINGGHSLFRFADEKLSDREATQQARRWKGINCRFGMRGIMQVTTASRGCSWSRDEKPSRYLKLSRVS